MCYDNAMKEYTIAKSDNGIRLDKLLFKIMPGAPSSVVYKSLRKKRVKVNGKRAADGSVRLCAGDLLEIYINDEFFAEAGVPAWESSAVKPRFLYEDENIAVLIKPSGLPSQDMPDRPGYSLESGFRKALLERGELEPGGAYIPSLCHRIDRNTSGLVLAAKNRGAHEIIAQKIKSKEIRKFYICRVEGEPRPKAAEIRGYISKVGQNKFAFSKSDKGGGKAASLKYRVIGSEKGASLVEVELYSGRTHQIRAVMSYLGCPIAGDIKYGAGRREGGYQELRAYKIKFEFKSDGGILEYLNGREFEHGEH